MQKTEENSKEQLKNRIQATKTVVEEVLKQHPETRTCDTLLWIAVCQKQGYQISMKMDDVRKAPCPETVSRARRKIYEEQPELKNQETQLFRRRKEQRLTEYYGEN